MKKFFQKGFTLIELLVVIAIIGILAATVFASLNDARSKGKDASIKTSLSSVRAQMEIYYAGDGLNTYGTAGGGATVASYTGGCNDTGVEALLVGAASNSPDAASGCYVGLAGGSYVAYVALNDPTGSNTDFCVDSTGFAGEIAGGAAARITTTTTVGCI